MDIGRSVTYVFKDTQWIKKVAIGGLLLFVPIFGWFVVGGYFLRLIRQVVEGVELPLPEWNEFGGDFVRGFKVAVVGVIWSLPVWIIDSLNWASGSSPNDTSGVSCLATLIGIVLGFVQPLVVSRLATTESVGSALDIVAIYGEARRVVVPLLVVYVSAIVIGIAAAFGLVLCIVGVVFTLFLGYTMIGHLYGQIRRQVDGERPLEPITPY